MDLNSPETWRWVWFVVTVLFVLAELFTPGTFFFLAFAVGALVAAFAAFLGLGVTGEWLVFAAVSIAALAGLWPLGRRLENADGEQEGVGATRWVGQQAHVVEDIEAGGNGRVRLEREEWRAESLTGERIRKGSTVLIARLAGTRLVVVPVDEPLDDNFEARQLKPGRGDSWPAQGATEWPTS